MITLFTRLFTGTIYQRPLSLFFFFFFLMSPAKDLSILIIFPKKQLLVSLTFFIICVFWGVEGTLFYFHSDNYFLPSADFGLCLLLFF